MPAFDLATIRERRAIVAPVAPGEVLVTASDESTDRYGDVIRAGGWELANYRKNPIVLWAHDHAIPIGNARRVWLEDNTLRAHIVFAEPVDEHGEPLTGIVGEAIRAARALTAQKVMRASSVGFRPTVPPRHRTDEKGEPTGGYEFIGQELLEISMVSVPANPAALAATKALNLSPEFRQRLFVEPRPALGHPRRYAAMVAFTRLGGAGRLRNIPSKGTRP